MMRTIFDSAASSFAVEAVRLIDTARLRLRGC